jgi:hypothetical protein
MFLTKIMYKFFFSYLLHKDNVKLKLPLCLNKHHAMKTYWGVEVQLHSFFDLGIRWRWVVSFTTGPLYLQGKSLQYPFDRRLGRNHNRSGRGVEKKNSQLPLRFELRSSDGPACSQSLYWLSYSGSDISHACYMPRPSHPLWLGHPSNIWWVV